LQKTKNCRNAMMLVARGARQKQRTGRKRSITKVRT
jgi:hypothetical protein